MSWRNQRELAIRENCEACEGTGIFSTSIDNHHAEMIGPCPYCVPGLTYAATLDEERLAIREWRRLGFRVGQSIVLNRICAGEIQAIVLIQVTQDLLLKHYAEMTSCRLETYGGETRLPVQDEAVPAPAELLAS